MSFESYNSTKETFYGISREKTQNLSLNFLSNKPKQNLSNRLSKAALSLKPKRLLRQQKLKILTTKRKTHKNTEDLEKTTSRLKIGTYLHKIGNDIRFATSPATPIIG